MLRLQENFFLRARSNYQCKRYYCSGRENLLFRITDANTENRLFGKIGISFTKDIFLVSTDKLPLEGAKFTRVEQQNGQVLIEAGINK